MNVPRRTDDLQRADDFWEASSLDAQSVLRFASRIDAYQPSAGVAAHTHTSEPVELKRVSDRLQNVFDARRSGRDFSTKPLKFRHVERILAATGATADARRVIPEAGGLDAVHVYGLLRNVDGLFGGRVIYYNHRAHSVSVVGEVPADAELRQLVSFDGGQLPQLVLVFLTQLDELERKYGARGSRFGLQQVGHAAQNVSLRLAHDDLSGYVLGGVIDHEMLALLRVEHLHVRCASAMACGW